MNFKGRINPLPAQPVTGGGAPARQNYLNPAQAIVQGGLTGQQLASRLVGKRPGTQPMNPAQALMQGRVTGQQLAGRLVGKRPAMSAPAPAVTRAPAAPLMPRAAAGPLMPRAAASGLQPMLAPRQQALTSTVLRRT